MNGQPGPVARRGRRGIPACRPRMRCSRPRSRVYGARCAGVRLPRSGVKGERAHASRRRSKSRGGILGTQCEGRGKRTELEPQSRYSLPDTVVAECPDLLLALGPVPVVQVFDEARMAGKVRDRLVDALEYAQQ